jgi:hypothetical protein
VAEIIRPRENEGLHLGRNAFDLRRAAAKILPDLRNVQPSEPIVVARGDGGPLHGRFSLGKKVISRTHVLTVASKCKRKGNAVHKSAVMSHAHMSGRGTGLAALRRSLGATPKSLAIGRQRAPV